jgi:hypothetical protein
MKKYGLYLLVLVVITSLLCGCTNNRIKAELGQEFSLAIGQSVVITNVNNENPAITQSALITNVNTENYENNNNLEITFEEVIEDSRCPKGVECVQEGIVVCRMLITEGKTSYGIDLAQTGLTTGYTQETYRNYRFTFKVEPYPEPGKDISSSEYRILLEISKL